MALPKCDLRRTLSNRLLNLDNLLRPLTLTVSKIVRVPKAAEIELQQKPYDRMTVHRQREKERGYEDRGGAKQVASRLMPVSQGRHRPKKLPWEF